jgi:hypothetical protein
MLQGCNAPANPPDFDQAFIENIYDEAVRYPLVFCPCKTFETEVYIQTNQVALFGISLWKQTESRYVVVGAGKLRLYENREAVQVGQPLIEIDLMSTKDDVFVDPSQLRTPADADSRKQVSISVKDPQGGGQSTLKMAVELAKFDKLIGAIFWNVYRAKFGPSRIWKYE